MAYGSDITEGLPYNLSNPVGATTFSSTGEAYDVSINALPFFMATKDETPYRRQTAQYRKNQVDQSNEPGEQSITGWWVRSQSSFHNGAGIKFYDPSAGEAVAHRFYDSRGCNIWTKGIVTLLNSTSQIHNTTGPIASNGREQQHLRSIQWGTTQGVLLHDEYDIDKIDSNGTTIHFTDYTAGVNEPVYAVCDDGTYAYFVTNLTEGGANKLHMFKKPLTGDSTTGLATSTPTGDVTRMFVATGTLITSATMEYVKERIVLCINNSVYEIPTTATSLGTAVYTHPNSAYVFSSVTASGPAIYVTGYNGIVSTIQKFTLSSTGTMPTLTSAITAAEMPVGERVHKISEYLGYMMIGTSKGVRVALINDQDGSLTYGPLIVETSQPVYDFAFRDKFVWCATGVAGTAGLTRIDLSAEIASDGGYSRSLRFAYANDIAYGTDTTHPTVSVAFIGNTDRLAFATTYANTSVGYVYFESATDVVSSGYITTGKIRYATLEGKVFKFAKARVDNTYGGVDIKSIDSAGSEYTIGSFSKGDFTPEVNISYPVGAQESLSFKFIINRNPDTDSTTSTITSAAYTSSTVAVFTHAGTRTVEVGQTVVVSGVTGGAYNGTWTVSAVTSNTFTVTGSGFTNNAGTGGTFAFKYINGCTLSGYQLKALPAIPRQRLIQYALQCYDTVTDALGNTVGYEGAAYDNLKNLEAVESAGDTIVVEDFRTGEAYTGIIEEIQFINVTPTDKRFSGFGGTLLVTIRTI